jgi:hypothetical protein
VGVSAHVLANEGVSAGGAKQAQTIADGEGEVVEEVHLISSWFDHCF